MIPRLLKNVAKIPEVVLKNEQKVLENAKTMIEKEFSAKIQIISESKSEEPKAKNALPGKPTIIIE